MVPTFVYAALTGSPGILGECFVRKSSDIGTAISGDFVRLMAVFSRYIGFVDG
jgi:hypothetical protein